MAANLTVKNIPHSPFTDHNRWYISFMLAFILHIMGFAAPALLRLLQIFLLSTFGITLFPQPLPKIKPPKQKEMQFMFLEKSPPEEVKDADKVSASAVKAKDMVKTEIEEAAPAVESNAKAESSLIGEKNASRPVKESLEMVEEPQPEKIEKAEAEENKELDTLTQAMELQKKEIEKKEEEVEKKKFELNEEAIELMPEVKTDDKIAVIKPEKKEKKKEEVKTPRPARKKIEIMSIGARAAREGNAPEENKKSSAKIEGIMAWQTLSIRHSEYFKNLSRRLSNHLKVIASISPRSYKVGKVTVVFGISESGALTHCNTIEYREGMVSEKIIVEKTIKAAAPFPPLTEEMKKDLELFKKLGAEITFGAQ
ncbi:MAG: hypothetical protein ACYTFY_11540 [Planctomycetota bacterium]